MMAINPKGTSGSKLSGSKLVVATHNQGKRREFEDLLHSYRVEVLASSDLGLADPVEDGATFCANALIKARSASRATGLASLGDDSGMMVESLDGQPGIHSARWAYQPGSRKRDFYYAMERVNSQLLRKDQERLRVSHGASDASSPVSRAAIFYTCICLVLPSLDGQDFEPLYFDGQVRGELVWPPRGPDGFGYDPMFQLAPDEGGDGRTFGEMLFEEKQLVSHRARALKKFLEACF